MGLLGTPAGTGWGEEGTVPAALARVTSEEGTRLREAARAARRDYETAKRALPGVKAADAQVRTLTGEINGLRVEQRRVAQQDAGLRGLRQAVEEAAEACRQAPKEQAGERDAVLKQKQREFQEAWGAHAGIRTLEEGVAAREAEMRALLKQREAIAAADAGVQALRAEMEQAERAWRAFASGGGDR